MDYDYSPFNPYIWGAFVAAWVVIRLIGNAYRKKYRFGQAERRGE